MNYFSLAMQLRKVSQSKRLAIAESCLIGLVAALSAVLLRHGIGWLGSWRLSAAQLLPAWLILPIVGLCGGFASGWLIERFAPEAAGSGIPGVKAALNYVPIPLDLRIAITKLLSATLTLASGMSLGRQGPTVHLGAALAAQFSRWFPTSPGYRRQLIAAGAAAGLAAGFNAPIAGVLFVVEELLQDVSEMTLGTAILASFIGAVVSRLLGGSGLNTEITGFQSSFSLPEVPLFMLLGVLAGLLGGVFNRGIILSLKLNRQSKLGLPWRMALAGIISGIVVGLLPETYRNAAGLRDVLMTGVTTWILPASAFAVHFLLTLVAYGSGAPGGLFAPSLTLGSALGLLLCYGFQATQQLVGLPPEAQLQIGSPTTYALAGMGAFFSAVARGPITAIVIVFEMTRDFNLVLPLMIGSVIAYLFAETVSHGSIYSNILDWSGIQLNHKAPIDGQLASLTAGTIMQRRVETMTSLMTIAEAKQAFAQSHHRGFPVVDGGKLVGIITQTDLSKPAHQHLSTGTPLSAIMTPDPVTVVPTDSLSHVLYLLNRYQISRLPVTEGRRLVGIITRADIIRAESERVANTTGQTRPRHLPAYVVYQTRDPAIGQGRLLVPLSNPDTAQTLLRLAMAIARDRHYEVECIQVILVSRDRLPSETPVRTTRSRRLLKQAIRLGKAWQVPVHTRICVTADLSAAILEVIQDRHIDLLVMGWKGGTSTPGRIFGTAVDTILQQASCDVVLVKLGEVMEANPKPPKPSSELPPEQHAEYPAHLLPGLPQAPTHPTPEDSANLLPLNHPRLPHFDRWLVPIGGGPNVQQAIQLLPALTSLSYAPEVRLCQVCQPSKPMPDVTALEKATMFLSQHLAGSVIATPVCATSVPEAIIDLAEKDQCDVIVMGTSREGALQQAIHGNVPEEIARRSACTVIVVRQAMQTSTQTT